MNTIEKIALVGVLLTSSVQACASVEEEITQLFKVGEASEFRLSNVNGAVEIHGWDKQEIKITAIIKADDQKARDRIEVNMTEHRHGMTVETHYKGSGWGWNKLDTGRVEYRIRMPHSTQLSDIELVNGSLAIEQVSGAMTLKTVNGSVTASGLANDSSIRTVNGSVKVLFAETSKQLRDIAIETVNGRVLLALAEDIDAELDVETMNGSIHTDFDLRVQKHAFIGKNLRGTLGTGKVRVNIETVNGSVDIDKI